MVDYMLQAGKTLLASYQRRLAPVVPRGGYAVTGIDEKLLEERRSRDFGLSACGRVQVMCPACLRGANGRWPWC